MKALHRAGPPPHLVAMPPMSTLSRIVMVLLVVSAIVQILVLVLR